MARQKQPLELEFPFEYVLVGRPCSFQGKESQGKKSKGKTSAYCKWRERAKEAVEHEVSNRTNRRMYIPTDKFLTVKIAWFSSQPDAIDHPDLDNIIKPLLDAIRDKVIINDSQVRHIHISKIDLNRDGLCVPPQIKKFEGNPEYDHAGEVVLVAVYPFDVTETRELDWWLS
ncbi:MAG: RusA family crossover junction endodeoxyribonuclease [Magnetococcales bacterium]|nr:RusA family crossover junction endodeoxyribonuclease [Magnetococcales bacterium]